MRMTASEVFILDTGRRDVDVLLVDLRDGYDILIVDLRGGYDILIVDLRDGHEIIIGIRLK
jgi:hypothetical protein